MAIKFQYRKVFSILMLFAGVVIFVFWLFLIDYHDLSWSSNYTSYIGIVNAMLIFAVGVSILIHIQKTHE